MRVWIDQDLCTGDGLCTEICPELFAMADDGLAYVREATWPARAVHPDGDSDPLYKMAEGLANIPDSLMAATIESAEECPGECIFITE